MDSVNILKYYSRQPRSYGFRFSIPDFFVIWIAGMANYFVWPALGAYSLIISYVVAHFFLYCNVFRIRSSYELIWASFFVIHSAICIYFQLNYLVLFIIPLGLTMTLIIKEIRSTNYHGIFAEKLNPKLVDYLNKKI